MLGVFKIGKTKGKYPTQRLSANNLEGLFYVSVPTATAAELSLLESVARVAAEKVCDFGAKKDTLDWFYYSICPEKGNLVALDYSMQIVTAVASECERRGLEYKICPKKG